MLFIGHTSLNADKLGAFINEALPQIDVALRAHDAALVVLLPAESPAWCEQTLNEARKAYSFMHAHRAGNPAPVIDRLEDYAGSGLYGLFHLHMDDLLPAVYFDYMAGHVQEQHVGMVVVPGGATPPVTIGGAMKVCKGAPDLGAPLQLSSIGQESPIISDGGIPAPLKAGPRRQPMIEMSVP